MGKIKLVIEVQDDDCSKCPYFVKETSDMAPYYTEYRYKCMLFQCKLNDKKPCVACLSCRVEDNK